MEFLYIAGVIVGIIIFVLDLVLCSEMANIAEKKGYSKGLAFAFCFFLWIAGILYVIALPDERTKTVEIKKEKVVTDELPEL